MIAIDFCRFVLRALVRLTMVALTLAIVLAAIAVGRLLIGPVSLASFLPAVEQRAADALGPDRLSIGDADLVLDARARGLRLTVKDLEMRDGAGAEVADFARVTVRLDPVALIWGRVSVLSAEIEGADAVLLRTQEGFFRFGLIDAAAPGAAERDEPIGQPSPDPAAPEAFDAVREAVEAMTGDGGASPIFADFAGLTVRDLNVTYRDALGGVVWRAPRTTVDFRNEVDGAWARASTAIDVDGSGQPVVVEISGRRRAQDPWLTLEARVKDAPTDALARQTPELDALTTIEGRVTGALRVRFNLNDGELGELSATLSTRDARIRLSETETVPLSTAEASFRFDPEADRLALERFAYASTSERGRIEGEISGAVAFERDASGQTVGARADIAFGPTRLGGPGLFEPPLQIDQGGAEIHLGSGPEGAVVAVSALRVQGPVIDLSGDVDLMIAADGAARMAAELTHGRFDATALDDLWPIGPAPGGRAWVAKNLTGGAIDDISISVRLGPALLASASGPPAEEGTVGEAAPAHLGAEEIGAAAADADAVLIQFVVDDLSGTYIDGFPEVTDAQGRGRLTLDRFTLDLDAAQTVSTTGAAVQLDGSRFVIPDFEPNPPPAEVRLRADGGLEDLVALLDLPPLSLIEKFGAKTSDFGGAASVEANLAFPLAKDLALEDIEVSAEAALADLRIDRDAVGAELEASAAALYVDKESLSLRARAARIDGRRSSVTLSEQFAPGPRAPRRVVELQSVIRPNEMSGLGDAAGRLGGVARVDLRMEMRDGRSDQLSGRVDLRDLSVDLPEFAWRKRAGEPGALEFDATQDGAGLIINRFEVGAVGARADGEIRFDPGGALQSVALDRLVVGDQVDLGVSLRRDGAVWRLTLDGERLDLTTAAPAMGETAQAQVVESAGAAPAARRSSAPPVAIDATVKELRLTEDIALSDARIVGERGADGAARLDVAAMAGAAPVTGDVRIENDRLRAALNSADAGGLLRALGLLDETRGGRLELVATGPVDGPYEGDLLIEGIVFEKVPPLLDAISVGLIFGALDKAASGGLSFNRITAPFSLDDEALRIGDGVAVGPSVGSTFSGTIAREHGALDMRGSLSPAYAINGLVGQVPVLGRIITGGRGEGVIGVAFSVSGSVDEPSVSVNPLSALTPGFLRRIFSARPGQRRADGSGRRGAGDFRSEEDDR